MLLDKALFTAREAAAGFVIGAIVGIAIGTVFHFSNLLRRGFQPYVVGSQTVPILAIAPMVVIWLGGQGLPVWMPVAVISAFLTFFPVAINTLRGLDSTDPRKLELMRSYAASEWSTLWRVKFPCALPYLFSAFKVAATASVVGAIIGELPSSIQDGLGGAILNFAQYYSLDPSALWATNIIAAALGILFFSHRRDRRAARRPASTGERRMTDAAAVSIRNVSKTFGKGGTTALQNIELEFQPGEFISLIGPSGCGKSTLLRVIGDLIEPTEGEAVSAARRPTRRGSIATTGWSSRRRR